jgi:hypothetical protein
MAISPEQTRKRSSKKASENIVTPSPPPRKKSPGMYEVFTSSSIKLLVLLLIMTFNVVVLKNCFILAAPPQGFSGNLKIDGIFYGIFISVMMVIILFHEENWDDLFCPGAVTLYLNLLILILYTRWFVWLIGAWWSKWLLSGLLIFLPVLGLFIMVKMIKNAK